MTDRESRDIWKRHPRGSEGDAHKDFEPVKPAEEEDVDRTEESEAAGESDRYTPRHRAPGRPPLIRRRRNKEGESEEVTWETPWTSSDEEPPRWSEQEGSAVSPPPAPIEDLPYLGPTRAEQRKKRGRVTSDEEPDLIRRSHDYTGRHLAPKKPGLFGRGGPPDAEEAETDDADSTGPEGLVEGDVEREPATSSASIAPEESTGEVGAQPKATQEPGANEGPEPTLPALGREPAESTPNPRSLLEPEPTHPTIEPDPTQAREPETTATSLPALDPEPTPEPKQPADPLSPSRDEPVAPDEQAAHDEPAARDEASGEEDDEDGAAGPRTEALHERKKKKRRWTVAGGVAALVLAVAGIAGAGLLVKNVVAPEKERVAVPFEQPEEETLGGTTLVFGTKESSSSGRGAIWMTLLTLDPETGKGSVVYIPAHTAVEVPGRGLQGVGQAYGSGGVPLLLVSAENLLGVKIDRYLELSDKDALVFFENLDTMTVDVPAEVRVPVGEDQARLIFVEGPQELSPSLLVKLLYIVGVDGDDVELGSRHLAFWDELLNTYADGSELASAVESAGAALGESDASAEDHGSFFAALADLPPEDLTITALPVRPISAGESELYATDEAELVAFVEETIGIDQERPQEIRVQVLNGNGVPGIGQEVAAQLVGEGFRVILSGNARRLNYRKTLVIAYDNSAEGIALAERARDLLGVGEVQVSAQHQGIVDLTIVVGKDFLRAR